jgi:hypothetical protein
MSEFANVHIFLIVAWTRTKYVVKYSQLQKQYYSTTTKNTFYQLQEELNGF